MRNLYLSLGTNLGDRIRNMEEAFGYLQRKGNIKRKSSFYQSESWGYQSKNHFVNCCLIWECELEPLEALEYLKWIEREMGRKYKATGEKYTDRSIDLDIIFVDQEKIDNDELKVPHVHYKQRRFVLEPLAEIAPEWTDPEDGKSMKEYLDLCSDRLGVSKIFLDK
ncbi:MAG: 2-amino-4-hydroxy-6-hydroxymethyldihydropteridine diphosphokinase [Bacteroidetes bacterium]|nr:MAG: 2-amino-4-hydroxy-6-hydroxymethyldihydropteridine diphosphokinase [Bacteroidota bacterium]